MYPDRSQRGLTLIELMVAMTLGLLLLGGLAALFVATNHSYRQNDLVAGMQDQARFALATLSRDLQMAGYWGGMFGTGNLLPNLANTDTTDDSTSATVGLPPANDCGPSGTPWSFQVTSRVEFRNQGDSTPVLSYWNCIRHHVSGTDVFAIRRVSGQATGDMPLGTSSVKLRARHFYLQTNGTVGTLIRWGTSDTASPDATSQPTIAPMTMYRYYPRIYYVRDFNRTVGDGVPTLCRKELCPTGFTANADPELSTCGAAGASAASAGFAPECLAEGVEDMQLVWGLDTDADDVVDRYTSTPTAAQVANQALVAQIYLLVRSRRGDIAHHDDKTYRIGDASAYTPGTVADPAGTPNDRKASTFYRRVYSTTVKLRNPVNG